MEASTANTPRPGPVVLACAIGVVASALAFATAADYGIASDVANYFASSRAIVDWTKQLIDGISGGGPVGALEKETLFSVWRWYLQRVPHPPLARELSGFSWAATNGWLDPLTAYRVAVMLCFGVLAAWVTAFTSWSVKSRTAGVGAGLAVVAYPVLFAHAHLAHTDLFLATFWFGAAASLAGYEQTKHRGWLIACGVMLGAAASTKFSGLLLAPMAGAWLMVRRPREFIPASMAIGLVGSLIFFALNPVLWVDPAVGLSDYFHAGASRATTPLAQIRTEYFGELFRFRPPGHYLLIWTLIVLPPTFILAIGVALTAFRSSWVVLFSLFNMAVLYGALLLPHAPIHDGVRLFLPVLPFQCVLVGLGISRAVTWLQARLDWNPRAAAAAVLVATLGPAFVLNALVHPHQLSYMNLLVGGTRGAERLGLEVTNLKEVLSPRVLEEMDALVPPGAIVDPGFLTEEVCFYRGEGYVPDWDIEKSLVTVDGRRVATLICRDETGLPAASRRESRPPDYVMVLNRKAIWRPIDREAFGRDDLVVYEIRHDDVPLLRLSRVAP